METFFLPLRFTSIFSGFTFTDAIDFAPLLSLCVGAVGVFLLKPTPQKKASKSRMALLLILALWPLLPSFGLFFLAREVQSINGAWPQAMVNDPKSLNGNASPHFDALFSTVNYLMAFSGAWMAIFFAAFARVRVDLSENQKRLCVGVFVIALLLTILDPGNLYAWWRD